MSKINIVLDSTMLDTFMSCECKFNYRFNMNKVTVDKADPLERGSLLHLGYETYFNGIKRGKNFKERIDESLAVIRSESALTNLESSKVDQLIVAFNESCTYYQSRDEQMEVLAVEQPFSYVLYEDEVIRIVMIGKIDLLVNEPGYTNLPYDHKSYEREYPLDRKANQFCNYSYACGSNYLMVNKVGLQKTLSIPQKHKRVPLSYDPLFHEQWKQNVIDWSYRYLECVQNGRWPLNITSCTKYNRPCEYTEVCDSSGLEAKIYKLEANFNIAPPWDVSKSLGERSDK